MFGVHKIIWGKEEDFILFGWCYQFKADKKVYALLNVIILKRFWYEIMKILTDQENRYWVDFKLFKAII